MLDQGTKPAFEIDHGYRASHSKEGYGEYYARAYQKGYYSAVWDKIERPLVDQILSQFGGADSSCLDFACGTGRITSLDAQYFNHVVGVDVSAAMLASASVPPTVRLQRVDITHEPLQEQFDVVTAFRFFLNAESRLRRDALSAIHDHLKENGRLICNIHENSSSINGLLSRIVNLFPNRKYRNIVGLAEFVTLLNETGYKVERVIHYGFFPGPWGIPKIVAETLVLPIEKLAKWVRLPNFLATNFIVICTKSVAVAT